MGNWFKINLVSKIKSIVNKIIRFLCFYKKIFFFNRNKWNYINKTMKLKIHQWILYYVYFVKRIQ